MIEFERETPPSQTLLSHYCFVSKINFPFKQCQKNTHTKTLLFIQTSSYNLFYRGINICFFIYFTWTRTGKEKEGGTWLQITVSVG